MTEMTEFQGLASLANSAGICLGPKYCFGLTRPGLALYGGIPVPGNVEQERARDAVGGGGHDVALHLVAHRCA